MGALPTVALNPLTFFGSHIVSDSLAASWQESCECLPAHLTVPERHAQPLTASVHRRLPRQMTANLMGPLCYWWAPQRAAFQQWTPSPEMCGGAHLTAMQGGIALTLLAFPPPLTTAGTWQITPSTCRGLAIHSQTTPRVLMSQAPSCRRHMQACTQLPAPLPALSLSGSYMQGPVPCPFTRQVWAPMIWIHKGGLRITDAGSGGTGALAASHRPRRQRRLWSVWGGMGRQCSSAR